MSKKYDQDKLPYDLLPFKCIDALVEIQKFGMSKYGANTWQFVKNGKQRYLAAAMRHISLRMQGEAYDKESGKPHLSHAFCCLMYALWFDLKYLNQHKHIGGKCERKKRKGVGTKTS